LDLPRLFISHSSRDDLAAEAIRVYLVGRGWSRNDIFLDFSVEGTAAWFGRLVPARRPHGCAR
jgi:hypothetical protein